MIKYLPVLRCIACQGDRPMTPAEDGTYRCASCGELFNPSEEQQ